MANRAIFNRLYTEFSPGTTPVWLVNGGSISSIGPSTETFFQAGADLIPGEVVYISGVHPLSFAFPASAASGVQEDQFRAVGITLAGANIFEQVPVTLDDIALVTPDNILGDTALIPGQYYFLSKVNGKLTPFSSSAGTVTVDNGYSAMTDLGLALSTTTIHVEIQPPVDLFGN